MTSPAKILGVDDEADFELLIRQRFRRQIRDGEFAFHFARHGDEALAVLAAEPDIELMLLDINMPVMDGLTLLTEGTEIGGGGRGDRFGALAQRRNGGGYDPEISLVQEAFRHLTDSASRIGARDWAKQQVRALVDGPCDSSRRHFQRLLAECLGRCGEEPVRD